jgi:succinate-semialdehyde dehydrogenase/glutarate-semialdehyde dehydrogenase
MAFASVNPATGREFQRFEATSAAEIEQRLDRAMQGFARWRKQSITARAAVMTEAAAILEREHDRLGALATQEMGKLLSAAIAEVDKCAAACRHFATHAPALLADEVAADTDKSGARELLRYEPLGPILAIMPWNFPYWQMMRFAAPGLMAGNVTVCKPAGSVPGCALALADVFHRAGAPAGVFETLLIEPEAAQELIADPRIAAVTLTGSERAGKAVGAAAGAALKKSILELGGSDPFIVLPSADLDQAVTTAVKARMVNNGQSCIAAKRFIIAAPIYEAFRERFVAKVAAMKVGDPMAADTDLGPLATAAIRDELARQVERSVKAGARLLTGGTVPAGPGFFYAPTVLEDVPPDAPAACEELFGPVAALFRARDLDHALAIANATRFGLGASVFTRDPAEAERCSREIEAGMVFVNDMVASDPRFPFGGVKHSGYGRELGVHGLRELINVKRVRLVDL